MVGQDVRDHEAFEITRETSLMTGASIERSFCSKRKPTRLKIRASCLAVEFAELTGLLGSNDRKFRLAAVATCGRR